MNIERPVILMAMANDPDRILRLKDEERGVRQNLANAHEHERIEFLPLGFTTIEDLFETINRKHRDLVIFHYCGHSGPEGLELESGDASSGSVSMLLGQEPNLKLVFLNGCANKKQVEILHKRGVRTIIATSVDINDDKAVKFAKIFYQSLEGGKNIRNSFDTAAAFIKNENPSIEITPRGGFDFSVIETDELPWGLYSIDESDEQYHIPLDEQLDETIPQNIPAIEVHSIDLDSTVARPGNNPSTIGTSEDVSNEVASAKGVRITTHDSRVENNDGAFIIKEGQILGRSHECDIVILDMNKTVSRKHARVFHKNGRMWIQDLDSSNGTFWNDERISQMPITENGVLRLDNVAFNVELIT